MIEPAVGQVQLGMGLRLDHGHVKVVRKPTVPSFPQAKRVGNPSEKQWNDSGQAGMTDREVDI
jgi:hypothetical protein